MRWSMRLMACLLTMGWFSLTTGALSSSTMQSWEPIFVRARIVGRGMVSQHRGIFPCQSLR